MALAKDFPQRNRMYVAEGCYDLPTHEYTENGDRVVISCWALNLEDINYINKHGHIYLKIIGGQPPVCILAEPIFTNDPEYSGEGKVDASDKWEPLYYPIYCYIVERWGQGSIKADDGKRFRAERLHRFVSVNTNPDNPNKTTYVHIGALGVSNQYEGPVHTLEDFKRIFDLLNT